MTCHPELEWNILTSRHTYNSDETNTDEVLTTIKMSLKSIPLRTAVLFITFLYCTQLNLCKGAPISGCKMSERNALLDLKRGLEDDANRLSSWISDKDCCTWEGIACNNITGHVVRLDLRRWSLGGKIGTSLLNLKLLQYLDLSMNNFGGIPFPGFIGSLHSLTYLNLSQTGFAGLIPHQLGNLSRLQYLDLSYDGDLVVDDALWISGLSSLRHLNMGTVFFQNESNWVEALNMLPSIIEIHLSFCNLGGISLSLPHINFTKLSILDLSYNNFNSKIPLWLFNIKSLTYINLGDSSLMGTIPAAVGNLTNLIVLDLGGNLLEGSIPAAVGNLTNLHVLDLGYNQLEGWLPKELGSLCNLQTLNLYAGANFSRGRTELAEIFSGCIKYRIENLDLGWTSLTSSLPEELGNLQMLRTLNMDSNSLYGVVPESLGGLLALEELDLSSNNLNGTIPASHGQLSKLVRLDLSANLFEGVISEAHFTNLTGLKGLDLSSNKLVLKVSLDWVPPFRLDSIGMGSCMLGPQFPTWLKTQRNVSYLDISNNGILGPLPGWFWNLFSCSSDAFYSCSLDISHNGITGRLPDLSDLPFSYCILNSNYLEGPFPNLSLNVTGLDLSNNSFSGLLPSSIFEKMPNLNQLVLSRNQFIGDIPPSLCLLQFLGFLDLSRNFLSGDLPNCWGQSNHKYILVLLDFSSNNLSGSVPHMRCPNQNFWSLHVSNNSLSGEIPPSLQRCTSLTTLDLGQNKLTGRIPTWIGESLVNLRILSLRSNMFSGKIPPNLSRLSALQILDVGNNNLSGEIPRSFGNFTAMAMRITSQLDYADYFLAKIKGVILEYDQSDLLLSEMILMDLSKNKFSGEIPGELVSLAELLSLNLSGNHLRGEIPQNIGLLHSLESLDLSSNEFTGAIPSSMTSLTFLSDLNLSYNNLSGSIPSGNQLSTFSNQSYIGNPGLCGFPLTKTCHTNGTDQDLVSVTVGSDMWCLYVSMGPGFVVGFWAVPGTLLLKKNWRIAYFQYIDYLYDRVYVVIVVSFNKLRGNVV